MTTHTDWLLHPPDTRDMEDILDVPEVAPDGRCSDCWDTGARYVLRDAKKVLVPCPCHHGARLRFANEATP